MRRFLYTALLVISIPSAEARLSNVSYDLPLTSFTFSPGSPSHYSSPYIHFLGNDGAQYSQRVERGGVYSIVVSAGIGPKSIAPAPRASARAGSIQGSRQRLRLECDRTAFDGGLIGPDYLDPGNHTGPPVLGMLAGRHHHKH